MMVDLLPETMRFVSIGEDGRFQLEFVFEVACGLARFTLPICVGGKTSIDEALVEATQQVRLMGLAMAQAAQTAEWVEPGERRPAGSADPVRIAARSAGRKRGGRNGQALVAGPPERARSANAFERVQK